MSDDCISILDPVYFLDELWENDFLSDDEDFPSSHTGSITSSNTGGGMNNGSNIGEGMGGQATIDGIGAIGNGSMVLDNRGTSLSAMRGNHNGGEGQRGPSPGVAVGAILEQVEEVFSFGQPLSNPDSVGQNAGLHPTGLGNISQQSHPNPLGSNVPNTNNVTILSQTPTVPAASDGRRRSLQTMRSPLSSSPISTNANLSPNLKRYQNRDQDYKIENIPKRISLAWDSFFQHHSKHYTHSTVLTAQDRLKSPYITTGTSGHTSQGQFSKSTLTLDNHYKQQYIETGNASPGIFASQHHMSESIHSAGISNLLSDFDDDSFLFSHNQKLSQNPSQSSGGGKWNENALETLWNDTLGSNPKLR